MTMDWTRVPVLVGAGQLTNRDEDPLRAPDPFTLMETAAREAASGIGPDVLAELTHLWMVHSMSVRHGDPAAYLAGRLGASSAETRCSGIGGSIPQWLVDRACELVCAGGRPRVLIVGAEALATRRRAKRAGVRPDWPSAPGWPDTWPPLEADFGVHPVERAHGLDQATAMYAALETAIAHGAGEDPDAHRSAMGELMDRFNAVAASNPHSWFGTRRKAEELVAVTDENRMICFPYPKYLNAVMDVDMSAAVVLTDAATARAWGLGPDELAYIEGWADAHDVWYLSQRPALARSPGLSRCGEAALGMAGVGLDEISAFDFYSCFPSSVEAARDSLGVASDDPRPLTLTGGLPYHGGPGSNYVTHSLANTLEWLRAGEGERVLVHGNGYYLTKHAVGLYSRTPPRRQPAPPDGLQTRVDAAAAALPVEDRAQGPGTVVAYTAPFSRQGGAEAAVVLVDLGGRRTVARADPELTGALLAADGVGSTVELRATDDGNRARGA